MASRRIIREPEIQMMRSCLIALKEVTWLLSAERQKTPQVGVSLRHLHLIFRSEFPT
jgi:hypothetical protein